MIKQNKCSNDLGLEKVLVNEVFRPCVYFLYQGERVVYVGQTKVGYKRIATHFSSDKIFDSFSFLYCDACDLDELESKYILQFNPLYNSQPTNCFTLDGIKSHMARHYNKRVYRKDIVKYIKKSEIEMFIFKDKACIRRADFDLVINHLQANFHSYIK